MRSCIIFLIAIHALAHAEDAAVSADEISKAEAAIFEIKADDFDVREKATRGLTALFKPATEARVEFWEAWLRKQIEASKKEPDLAARLSALAPTETLEFHENETIWKIPIYTRDDGLKIIHGEVRRLEENRLVWSAMLRHGKMDGEFTTFYSKDESPDLHPRVREQYTNGSPTGYVKYFHPNGVLSLSGQLIDGLTDGEFVGFDDKGTELGRYSLNRGAGVYRTWHPNGHVSLEMECEDGLTSGRFERWESDGTRVELTHYKYDPATHTVLPDGSWEGWVKTGDVYEKSVELRFNNGIPTEGYVATRQGQDQGRLRRQQWLSFTNGVAHLGDANDGTSPEAGDFKGTISVKWDRAQMSSEVEFKDSRIRAGRFMGVQFTDGKPVGRGKPRDPGLFFAEKLKKLLARPEKD